MPVARNACKLEFSKQHIFLFNGLKYIYIYLLFSHLYERIFVFYHVVLRISRLADHIFVIYAT